MCVCGVCVCAVAVYICMVPGSRLDTSQDRRQTVSARGIISRARGNFTDREQTRFRPPSPLQFSFHTGIWKSRAKRSSISSSYPEERERENEYTSEYV